MNITEFYIELMQDIYSEQISDTDGCSQEQLFTQIGVELLCNSGESENVKICYDRKEDAIGRTIHKINAYSLYENYETLDLFITIYKNPGGLYTVTKQEIETAIKQMQKFLISAIKKDYVTEIEESSEIFDLANTLSKVPQVKEFLTRINLFIISNGVIKSELKNKMTILDYPTFIRVIDIQYMYNLSDKDRIPIEIDFSQYETPIPCIKSCNENALYETYLALIPGYILADIYEEYGSRLLEQNVRSFLQFTGKINRGIRNTIRNEPHMFLAYNNGISVTVEKLGLSEIKENGYRIKYANDFQIVNGGQTTASIYHTWKKDKVDIEKIFVQTKISVIKEKNRFEDIVNKIAEYANTQNKVSTSDLSSNRPFHIELEKISRVTWAPPASGSNTQTRWFYERSRGQYRNARLREGFTKSKRKAFEARNPLSHVITKELLAKYINSYSEVFDGKKLVIGPHIVVRGSQKNYAQFLSFNINDEPNNIYFEDLVAKAILFKTAEKIYGINPNSIGDMRYITVPYAIGWLSNITRGKINLFNIWKNQALSDELKKILKSALLQIDKYIIEYAPGSLHGEWAKKEECWDQIKGQDFGIDLKSISEDLGVNNNRKRMSKREQKELITEQEVEIIRSVPPNVWHKIVQWGQKTKLLSEEMQNIGIIIASKNRNNSDLDHEERFFGSEILKKVSENEPELINLDN